MVSSASRFDALLNSPDFAQNPYPVYDQLRVEAPIYWSDAWHCWLVSRYRDVVEILHDHARFSNVGRLTAVMQRELAPDFLEQADPLLRHYSVGLLNADPPDHTRLRSLVRQGFTPRAVEELRPRIQALVDGFIDAAWPTGRIDMVHDLAFPLPATVVAEMMGVPAADRNHFKNWTDRIMEFQANPRPSLEVVLRSQEALLALRAYFSEIVAERRRHPRADLITVLAEAKDGSDRLSEEELLATCVSILVGGHHTTTNLIASGLYLLLTHPAQMQTLQEHPELVNTAVEEFLRYESPSQRDPRIALEDVSLNGARIRRGDAIMLLLGAANRDPEHFVEPSSLNIVREPNKHIAFGYGVHFCLGAALARLEAQTALSTILRRLPRLQLVSDDIVWSHAVFRGPRSLPTTF